MNKHLPCGIEKNTFSNLQAYALLLRFYKLCTHGIPLLPGLVIETKELFNHYAGTECLMFRKHM